MNQYEEIQTRLRERFPNTSAEVCGDRHCDIRLWAGGVGEEVIAQMAAYVLVTFPNVKTIAYGGGFMDAVSLLRYAYRIWGS